MRRAQRRLPSRAWVKTLWVLACLSVFALVAGAWLGAAFAEEGTDAGAAEKAEQSAQAADDAQGSQSGTSDGSGKAEGGSGETDSSSKNDQIYYQDLWYEAGQGDGTVKGGETEEEKESSSEDGGKTEGSSDAAEKESAEAGDGAEGTKKPGGAESTLDPELNDLGEGNYIDFQQIPDTSFLYDTSIYDLVQGTTSGNRNTTVQVKGEVVGEPIRGEQGKYWITLDHVDDDVDSKREASISVLVDESSLRLIDTYGGYNKRGTILSVKGSFYYACTSHEGIMDIHAETVRVVTPGETWSDELDLTAFLPGIMLGCIALALTILYHVLAEMER